MPSGRTRARADSRDSHQVGSGYHLRCGCIGGDNAALYPNLRDQRWPQFLLRVHDQCARDRFVKRRLRVELIDLRELDLARCWRPGVNGHPDAMRLRARISR